MSLEENKAVAHRYHEEVIHNQNLDVLDEVCAPDVVWHDAPSGVPAGLEGLKGHFAQMAASISDVSSTVEDVIAEGDRVAVRFTTRFRHTGELMGIAPTGKEVEIGGIAIDRIADGRIAEMWRTADTLDVMQQSGLSKRCLQAQSLKCRSPYPNFLRRYADITIEAPF
jgi:predicted ester cyclase